MANPAMISASDVGFQVSDVLLARVLASRTYQTEYHWR